LLYGKLPWVTIGGVAGIHVVSISIQITQFDPARGRLSRSVVFNHNRRQSGKSGTAHFHCIARIAADSPRPLIEHALLNEACRQVNFMPEYRLRKKALTFSDLEEHQASA